MKEIRTNNREGYELISVERASNNLKTCLLTNEKISKGEKIVNVINGGSQYNSQTRRSIKFDVFKKEMLKFLASGDKL